jgi:hypothetical protein
MPRILLIVAVIAVVVWLLVRLLDRRISGSAPRVIAPDDDPDFLRGLDRREPDGPTDD